METCLGLIDIPQAKKALNGAAMGLGGCVFVLLQGIIGADDLKVGISFLIQALEAFRLSLWWVLRHGAKIRKEPACYFTIQKYLFVSHMRNWFLGHDHDLVSFGVWYKNNHHQIPEGCNIAFLSKLVAGRNCTRTGH